MSLSTSISNFFTNTRIGLFLNILNSRFWSLGCNYRAGSLVYSTLLCLIPFLFTSITLLFLLPGYSDLEKSIEKILTPILLPAQIDKISSYLQSFLAQIENLSIHNSIVLILISVWMIYNMAAALNLIWKSTLEHSWIRSISVYFITVILGPLSIGALCLFWAFVETIPYLNTIQDMSWATTFLSTVLPYLLFIGILTVLNAILPTANVEWFSAFVGSLVTFVLFIFFKWIFVTLIMSRAIYHILYGNLAIIPLFMIWIYFFWVIILLGALSAYNVSNGLSLSALKKLANES